MNIILGGGLSGLAAGHTFTKAGAPTVILEKGETVGGLARTVRHGDFKFDLGGHRFLSDNRALKSLVADLLGPDLLTVPRTSQIYMAGKFYNYPLTPGNAIFGAGLGMTGRMLFDYGREKLTAGFSGRDMISLEDWVVAQYGRTIFNLYFKEYSEKVWGIGCDRISMDWVAKRIDGLSLWQNIRHALFKRKHRKAKTLTDNFLYPRHGIGEISDKLKEYIQAAAGNQVKTGASVQKIISRGDRIETVVFETGDGQSAIEGESYLSSIPLTTLIGRLHPRPPYTVLKAASEIRFRSLVIATLMLDREKLTDLTWMYLPGREIPFGRIHEPKNWSPDMAPDGKCHVVAEFFCNTNDRIWNTADDALAAAVAEHLQRLGFLEPRELIDFRVLRIPYAYPVFSVGYEKHVKTIIDYLDHFRNLHLIGRSGRYSYLNMNHAMESGIETATGLLAGSCRQTLDEPSKAANKRPADRQLFCQYGARKRNSI